MAIEFSGGRKALNSFSALTLASTVRKYFKTGFLDKVFSHGHVCSMDNFLPFFWGQFAKILKKDKNKLKNQFGLTARFKFSQEVSSCV